MNRDRLFIAIFLVSAFLIATVGFEAEGGSARTELEKKGYIYTGSSFVECAKKGDLEAVKLFLDAGMDINAVNQRGQTALIRAAEYQRGEVVTLLLENGADVNLTKVYGYRTALMEAAGCGNCVIIRQLAEKGAGINAKDGENHTPLHYACMYGHVEAVSLLIELGADPDIEAAGIGRTPMTIAETNGYDEIVQILKDAGAKK